MIGFLVVVIGALALCQVLGGLLMPLCPRVRDGFEEFDLLETVRAVEALRGDGKGRRCTGKFMVGDPAAPPADAGSC